MNIRVFSTLVLVAVTAWSSLGSLANAQQQPAAAAPAAAPSSVGSIAIIDMGKIYTGCTQYKTAVEALKQQVLAQEGQFKAQYEKMQAMGKELQQKSPGTPEYRSLEATLTKMDMDLKYNVAQSRKDFEEKVNQVQFALYTKVNTLVNAIATRNNLGVVLRHNTTAVNGTDPQQVLRAINNTVVYYNPMFDITNMVLQLLEADKTPLSVPATAAARPATAPLNK